jgi:hypothetical protein
LANSYKNIEHLLLCAANAAFNLLGPLTTFAMAIAIPQQAAKRKAHSIKMYGLPKETL